MRPREPERPPLERPAPSTRLLALVEYDGTDFAGFQLQARAAAPHPRTVQGVLEAAVAPLAGPVTRIVCAGRTDAGVHAAGQVVHLDTAAPLAADLPRFLRAWNARLPDDVRVRAARPVPPHVHARGAACSRTYAYRIVNAPVCSPLLRRYAHHVRSPLSLGAMRAAAAGLRGEHDFAAFAAGEGPGSTRRTVFRATVAESWVTRPAIWHTFGQWVAQPLASPRGPLVPESVSLPETGVGADGELVRVVVLEVEANAFLRHMMRRIAGTLVEIGLGSRAPDDVGAILAAGDKARAGQTAPARGLCLQRVSYRPLDERDDEQDGTETAPPATTGGARRSDTGSDRDREQERDRE